MTHTTPSFDLITTTDDLHAFCIQAQKDCHSGDFLTLDTEFIREKTFYPQLCLIQAATEAQAVIIDPLAPHMDLSPLLAILKDEDCQIVVHAGRQDMEIFYNIMGELPTTLFDTQIAAMVCGFGESASYETLVKSICKKSLDKTSRFSNWAARPLTEKQLKYAISDVTHLRDIFTHLNSAIRTARRETWITEEMTTLLDPKSYQVDYMRLLQKLRLRTNKPHILSRADALLRWRESQASREDRPRQHMMRDELITELATQYPQSKTELKSIRGIRDRLLKHTITEEILSCLKTASGLPEDQCPKLPSPENHDRIPPLTQEAIRLILKYVAEKEGVAEKIIASSKDISILIRKGREADIPCLSGWRRTCFGDIALNFLAGHVFMRHNDQGLYLEHTDR